MTPSPEFEAWAEEARAADITAVAATLGARLKKAGAAEMAGPCPLCGGTDRFSINTKKRIFNCRGSGEGGDVIAMVQHVRGCDFIAACEEITGESPPRGESRQRQRDPEIDRERRQERRDADLVARKEDAAELSKAMQSSGALFARAKPMQGTAAEDYLDMRGVLLSEPVYEDLRFIPGLEYYGYADADADQQMELGRFHCLTSAIRDVAGEIIGVHRTYINPEATKLRPPGDRNRNAAKKAYQRVKGGLIRLGEIRETLAMGEGLETTLSWFAMARRGDFGDDWVDPSIACAVSLGNLCGSAAGSIPHPTIKGRTIMNGDPATDAPGAAIPAHVRRIVLIGDGDSDGPATMAALLTAARRHRAAGVDVHVALAPAGSDFNDVLLSNGQIEPPQILTFDEFERAALAAMTPPPPPREKRLGRISIGEIAVREKVAPPEYVIDGWMIAREQSFLAGESQSGKSFLALHAAMSIATGRDILGRKTKPGLVIYQAGESGFGVTSLRIPAWIQQFGEGVDFSAVPFEIIPAKVNLFRPDGNAEEFHAVVRTIQKEWQARAQLRAIIIDTMSKVMSGANENDGRDVGRVLEHGERLSRETGAHVCFVHHLPKNGTGMRGHGSLKGDTDSVVMVRSSESGVRTVTFDKVKDGEAGGRLSFELMQTVIGYRDEDGERITSCVVMPVGDKEAARKSEESKGFALGVNEAPIFAALMAGIKKAGRFADAEMEAAGVPAGMVAVDWDIWREEYRFAVTPDADGNPPSNDVIRQHFKRYGQNLHHRFNVIGRSGRWLWWTGKKVRGFSSIPDGDRTNSGQGAGQDRDSLQSHDYQEQPF